MTRGRRVAILVCIAVAAAGCTAFRAPRAPAQKSLYERLGGRAAIQAVVDDFLATVAVDTRINRYFANANIPRLKGHLVDQICQASGGPCAYSGQTMKEAHRGMGVTDAAFDALVEDLVRSLNKFKVPEKERGELLAVLGPMKADIVE
jgi:hemoglobin